MINVHSSDGKVKHSIPEQPIVFKN